ncbi:serine/threonine protein kinase [Ktedonobacteria bacterium brp13]|nr:serine/threonine protein kinase [Ktedonobacteria bacterium brp13]
MGAVFLAQQSRPRRQVAVKVLLPITPLNDKQLAAFLERFRRESDAAASLEHPNIMPVHEYGEQGNIVYLVMPYVGGGTLRDELERTGPLSLQKTVDYLEQLAAALDFAHEHGVIHRDIKPANMMITSEGRLLLSDFGLVKIVADGQTQQVRLTGAGAPVGTPDYMAPEQVIGEEVDTRADLYSLGVILFQMLTGTTPFQGETPMQIAAQHLQIPPPSPQMLRPDLPIAAEQVVLRAMAKRPADRFMKAREMAIAFRYALLNAGIQLNPEHTWAGLLSGSTASRLPVPKGQFEPLRQTASMPRIAKPTAPAGVQAAAKGNNMGTAAGGGQFAGNRAHGGGLLSRSNMFIDANPHGGPGAPAQNNNVFQTAPAANATATPTNANATATFGKSQGLLSRTGKFPMVGASPVEAKKPQPAPGQLFAANQPGDAGSHMGNVGTTGNIGNANMLTGSANSQNLLSSAWSPGMGTGMNAMGGMGTEPHNMNGNATFSTTGNNALAPFHAPPTTGTLTPGNTGTLKLNEPVKVVKVPVGDQPGQYITGILPFEKQADETELAAPPKKPRFKPWQLAILAVVLLLVVLGTFAFIQSKANQTTTATTSNTTASKQSTATDTNTLLNDPLDKNINGWPDTPASKYTFKNGAYHIIDTGNQGNGVILPGQNYTNLSYTVTMQEIKGDDTSTDNSFGVIFRFNQQTVKSTVITRFYSLEVVNTKGGQYQFWMYDSSKPDSSKWTKIKNGTLAFGKEYHQGKAANTITISMKGSVFTISVNGTQLKQTFTDSTLKSGTLGMIVNNNGTEVAYKNLLLTKN